jgi:branched-chain amino acid transport system substrate-binding protein
MASLARLFGGWAWAAMALLGSQNVLAQILVGQTAGFSGISAGGVKETTEGALLYFGAVNARGGVNGQKIELISLDDKFEPKLAAENARILIAERKVIGLFLTRGTPHTEAILPLLSQYKVPLVAPSTGAMLLHEPVNRYVFNVRATYQREAEKAVMHLASVGTDRIALLQVNDSFGNDGTTGAMKGFDKLKLQPVLSEKFDRAKPDFAPLVKKIVAAAPQAILFIGTNLAVADGVKQIRAAGSRAQIVTLSNNASAGFIKALAENAHGTVVTQVFPGERALAVAMVKELTDLAAAKGIAEISPAMLEGFAGAKVLVEGLRRAGSNPGSESLTRALESMNNYDLGGLKISYSPTDHTGLDYADLSIIGKDGKFRR